VDGGGGRTRKTGRGNSSAGGTTGKKTDNKDFAIKNPDKRGVENNENDLDSIERSVKDDDPAKAGFFFGLPIRVQILRPARLRIIAAWQVTRSLEMRCT
jgi:hypothetical protein